MDVSSWLSFRSACRRWNHQCNCIGKGGADHLLVTSGCDLRCVSGGGRDFNCDGGYFEVIQRPKRSHQSANGKSCFPNCRYELLLRGFASFKEWRLCGIPVQEWPVVRT